MTHSTRHLLLAFAASVSVVLVFGAASFSDAFVPVMAWLWPLDVIALAAFLVLSGALFARWADWLPRAIHRLPPQIRRRAAYTSLAATVGLAAYSITQCF